MLVDKQTQHYILHPLDNAVLKFCKERQEFWKQYNIKIGHEQKKRNELRRQFQEQAAKMEALRKRHERQRSTRRRFHI